MKRGVTLIEMLVYMGLLSIIILVLSDIFSSVVSVQLESESASSIDQDGQYITSRFMYDMNRASSILSPANLGETTSSLSLRIDGVDNSYSIIGNNLVFNDGSESNLLNSFNTNISNVSFIRIGNLARSTITMSFTVTSKTVPKSGPKTRNFQVTQTLRPN